MSPERSYHPISPRRNRVSDEKDMDKALERFKAAVGLLEDGKDRSLSRNDRASLLAEIFYRASLIHIANGKQDRAVASLREGLRYDPARIKRYIESKKELESVRTYVSASRMHQRLSADIPRKGAWRTYELSINRCTDPPHSA